MRARTPIRNTGAELDENAVPLPCHDIFVLTRRDACASVRVTFREPGKPSFDLELPLNSSLANVKAALVLARLRQKKIGHSYRCGVPPAASDECHCNCTLIVRGRIMSSSYLLGDYVVLSGAQQGRRPVSVLVLWREWQQPGEEAKKHLWRCPNPPAVVQDAIAPVWQVFSQSISGTARCCQQVTFARKGLGERGAWKSRRSVQRHAKSVVEFSGIRRGARCGLGIRPLLVAAAAEVEIGAGAEERRARQNR